MLLRNYILNTRIFAMNLSETEKCKKKKDTVQWSIAFICSSVCRNSDLNHKKSEEEQTMIVSCLCLLKGVLL